LKINFTEMSVSLISL